MTSPTFLTPDELATMTGYKLPCHQRTWLEKRGWIFVENRSRKPIVSRAYAEQRLGAVLHVEVQQSIMQPNFATLL